MLGAEEHLLVQEPSAWEATLFAGVEPVEMTVAEMEAACLLGAAAGSAIVLPLVFLAEAAVAEAAGVVDQWPMAAQSTTPQPIGRPSGAPWKNEVDCVSVMQWTLACFWLLNEIGD